MSESGLEEKYIGIGSEEVTRLYREKYWTETESYCVCCGTVRSVYLKDGHDPECIWYGEQDD